MISDIFYVLVCVLIVLWFSSYFVAGIWLAISKGDFGW